MVQLMLIKGIGKAAIEGRVVPMSRLKHSAGSGGRGGEEHGSSLLMSSAILLQERVTEPRSRVDRSVHCSTREIAGLKQRKEAPAAAAAAAPLQTPQD
jgi:hypothetical protein